MRCELLGKLVLVSAAISNLLAQDYVLTTIAGGAPPPTPMMALQASIGYPSGITIDASGSIFFAALQCVFKIDTTETDVAPGSTRST